MNQNLMLLLPLLLAKNNGGINPEMIMKIMGNENPMISSIIGMMCGEKQQTKEGVRNPTEFLDGSVVKLLKLLIELNGTNP